MFDSIDLVRPVGWQPAPGGITLSFWRHGRPTPARIERMLSCPPGADHDRVERIGAWEKVIAWAQARQCAEIASFVDDTAAMAAAEPRGFTVQDAIASAEAEIALILHTTTRTAAGRAEDARQLAHRFPATRAALLDGRITLAQARAILDTGADLDDDHAPALEQQLLGRAGRQTLGQLRESARRAVLRIDPQAAQRRHARKRRERKVVLHPERDGMATLAATLPAAEAVGVYAVLDQHARACHGEPPDPHNAGSDGERRSMDARRADTLVDLILGETGFRSTGTATADPADPAAHPTNDHPADPADTTAGDTTTAPDATADVDVDADTDTDTDTDDASIAEDIRGGDHPCGAGPGGAGSGGASRGSDPGSHGDPTDPDDSAGADTGGACTDAGGGGGAGMAEIAATMPDGNRDRLAWARWLATPHRTAPATAGPAPPPPPDPRRLPARTPPGPTRRAETQLHVQVRVTVPLDVLTGHSEHPAELAGYGPIPASTARELAADPDSTWQRLITDPVTGALLDHGTTRYRPPTALREHVNARHQTCQFPGCRTPAHRCDLDHNVPYDPDTGMGPTSAANLGPKCRPHHRLKGMPGWEVHQYPDGTIVWHTPSGHTYTVEPRPLTSVTPRPAPPIASPTDDNEPPPF